EDRLIAPRTALELSWAALVLYALGPALWPALTPFHATLPWRRAVAQERVTLALALGGAALGTLHPAAAPAAGVALLLHAIVKLYNRALQAGRSPSLVFVGSFAGLIALGALALSLPAATPADDPLTPLDALFTATSAVCVTGLIVRDTATEFTRFGQSVILALIQLGGLGIVFFAAFLGLVMGSSLSVRATQSFRQAGRTDVHSSVAIRRVVVFMAGFIFAVEAAGALALFLGWPREWTVANGMDGPADKLFHSVFFAVSAFCNAGFATTTDSLEGLRLHWTSHIVVAGLIVLGGLGFPVVVNLRDVLLDRWRARRRRREVVPVKVRLHVKLALWTTLLVYLAGVVGVLLGRTLQRDVSFPHALLDAHFASITARTAGFDTVPPAEMGPLARFVLIFQMFIGGSPGSTAGGVKTIVFSVMMLTVWATMLGKSSTQVFGRALAETVVRQAAALIVLGLATVTLVASVLVATDGARHSLEELLFEAVSATGTVGLSLGVTADLSAPGRVAVIAGMFLGRVGPLAVAVALAEVARRRRAAYAYPTEDVLLS
ncbi:MAG: hypothetical protein D6824_07530, partial [Planctomycetota bacterium]